MTKALRKAIANRSRLENRYYRQKTDDSKTAYLYIIFIKNKRTIAVDCIKRKGKSFMTI